MSQQFDVIYEAQDWTRKFWAIPEFYNYSTDDFLLGVLLYYARSSYNINVEDDGGKIYLPIAAYTQLKKQIADWEGCSIRTIERHMDYLLLQTSLVEKEGTCYKFRNEYEENSKEFYVSMPHETLWLLLKNYHLAPQLIKIYVYLVENGLWLYLRNKEGYNFTINLLMEVMGYKGLHNQKKREEIKQVLKTLCRLGLINLHREYISPTKTYIMPTYIIDSLTLSVSELQPMRPEQISNIFLE